MATDLESKIQGVSTEQIRIKSMKKKLRWLTGGLILLALVAIGLVGMVFFPDVIQRAMRVQISFGDSSSAVNSENRAAYMGIEIRDLPSGVDDGVLVSRVAPASPAAAGGLKPGDIIIRYNRSRVTDTIQFQRMLAQSEPGDRVKIVADRNGNTRYFYLLLAERPAAIQLTAGPPFAQDDAVEQWGCTLSALTDSLRQKLAIPAGITGVVVVSVDSSGLAKSAGLSPGDLIVGVNRDSIQGVADFYAAIENQKTVALEVFRNGNVLILSVEQKSAVPPLVTIAGSVTTAGDAPVAVSGETLPSVVAIAAVGNTPAAQMALRFGTAPNFIIYDLKTGQYGVIANTALTDTTRGYGIVASQLMAARGVGATVAGAYGSQTYTALTALGIRPFVANPGTVNAVFSQYRQASLAAATDDALSGFGYARSVIPTGGAPFASDEDDEEEEQSGYKGMPYTLPPQGKYDAELDPANATQLTAGGLPAPTADSGLNLNQQTVTCLCPLCNIGYDHPAGVPCSSLECKVCGSRLISLNAGAGATVAVSGVATPARVAIAADDDDMNAPVARRFSLAKYFIIADLSTNQVRAVENTALANTGAYGVAAAQLVAAQGVGAAVAIAYGLPSYYGLKALEVSAYTANPGTVANVLTQYRSASLSLMTPVLPPTMQSVIATGGAPFASDEDDEEEAQSGYKGMPYTLPPQGKYDAELDPANALQTTAGVTTQRAEYCLCPVCQILVPHAAGISCSDMACPQCGNRLMNADPGTTSAAPDPSTPTQSNQLQSNTFYTQPSGTSTQTQSRTGTAVAGQPTAGTSSLSSTGVLQGSIDGSCLCPNCGATVPHVRGTACSTLSCPRCGTAMIGDNTSLTAGMPETIPPADMGQSTAGMPTAGMPTAGMPTAGMPTAGMPTAGMPTAGMPTAGMPTAGTSSLSTGLLQGSIDGTCLCPKCGTTVPHVRGTACTDTACPNCSTPMIGENTSLYQYYVAAGSPVAGMPESIPPATMGQSTAGLTVAGIPNISSQAVAGVSVSGMPESIPPTTMAQAAAGLTVAGIPNISQTTAGVTVAGMPATIPPMEMGEAVAGITVAGTVVAGAGSGKICIATTGPTINAPIADVFDKAPYFLMVGVGSMDVMANPNAQDRIGSGVQSAQLVVSEGADVVITNDIGIKAIEELYRLQVKVYTGVTGTAKEALSWYQNNRLVPTKLNSSGALGDSDEEEQHGPPTSSKSKSKGETTTL